VTTWIRTASELERFVADLHGCTALALDSEADGLHHYTVKVCLVQIATERGAAVLVDPLACRDLTALGPLLADARVTKVLHGADYDVTSLKRDFGLRFEGLFDTMIAARLLGRRELGLQAVAAAELGVALSKDNQRDDWSRRPLSPQQEEYALADVRHLLALHARLRDALVACGRLDWVLEECQAVSALEPAARATETDGFLRVKGAGRLSRRALAVLREVWTWREGLAEAADLPPFRVLSTEPLLALAEKAPGNEAELRAVRGLSPAARRHSTELLAAIARALALPERELPHMPRNARPVIPEAVRTRIDALRAWRTGAAAQLDLDASIVLPQRLLDKVAEAGPRQLDELAVLPGLRRWRVETFGPGLLQALAPHP
jgi:ribonuclease D